MLKVFRVDEHTVKRAAIDDPNESERVSPRKLVNKRTNTNFLGLTLSRWPGSVKSGRTGLCPAGIEVMLLDQRLARHFFAALRLCPLRFVFFPDLLVDRADGGRHSAETAKADLTLSLLQFPTTGDYVEGFAPTVLKKTVTDADGRFSITYPRGKAFTFFATAQRIVTERTEHYCWLVDVPTNSESSSFVLSTGNLTLIDPDGYFEHKPR